MTRIVQLSKEQRLRVSSTSGVVLLCHLEQINKNGHWNGRAWFYMTRMACEELLEELSAK